MDGISLNSKTFPYLAHTDIQKINEGFNLLSVVIPSEEEYPGAVEYSRRFEKPSILISEGITYTLTSSSEPVLNK